MTEEKILGKRKPISVVTPVVGKPVATVKSPPRASQSTVITNAIPTPRPSTRIVPTLTPGRLQAVPVGGPPLVVRPVSVMSSVTPSGGQKNPAQTGIPARAAMSQRAAPRPTSVTTRTSIWSCSKCEIPLAREAVVAGEAELKDGILVCAGCANKEAEALQRVRNRRRMLIAAGVATLISLVVFPPLGLMVLMLASLAAVAVGLWGDAAKQRRQTKLVVSGLAATALCLGGLQVWISYHAQARAGADSSAEVAAITALLRDGKYGEAQNHNLKLQTRMAAAAQSGMSLGVAEAALTQSQNLIQTWIHDNFGQLTAEDTRAADALLRQLNTNDGHVRLTALGTADGVLKVSVLSAVAEPDKTEIAAELQQVGSLVLTSCPDVQNVEITLVAGTRATSHAVGSATAGRAKAMIIDGEIEATRLPNGPPVPPNPIPDARRVRP